MTDTTTIRPRMTAERVARTTKAVADAFQVSARELVSDRRGDAQTAAARLALYRLLYETTSATLHQVGAVLGRRHHTTVLHGVQEVDQWPTTKPAYARAFIRAQRALSSEAVTR